MAERSDIMLSLNDVGRLVDLFSRGRLGQLVDPGVLSDCTARCGCVGGNCECNGGVKSALDRSWGEVVNERQTRIAELRHQLEMLEKKGGD